jgi:hypothetical protein
LEAHREWSGDAHNITGEVACSEIFPEAAKVREGAKEKLEEGDYKPVEIGVIVNKDTARRVADREHSQLDHALPAAGGGRGVGAAGRGETENAEGAGLDDGDQ